MKKFVVGVMATLCVMIGLYFGLRSKGETPEHPKIDPVERELIARAAIKQGMQAGHTWPIKPEATVQAFWEALQKDDIARALELAPGTKAEDFDGYRVGAGGVKAIRSVAPAIADPGKPGSYSCTVTIDFGKVPNKNIQMGVTQLPTGGMFIDGRTTVWW